MNTDLGTAISDLKLTNIDDIDNASYKGHLKIIDFELGKFAKDSLMFEEISTMHFAMALRSGL